MTKGVSIRQRLTVTHVGLTFILLAALGWGSYLYFETNQEHILDNFLLNEASQVADSCSHYLTGHPESALSSKNLSFQKFLHKYWDNRLDQPLPFKSTIYIFDTFGQILGVSNHALDLRLFDSQAKHRPVFFKTVTNDGPPYRVLEKVWSLDNEVVGYVSVACLLTDKNATAWGFGLTLFLLLTASVLVSSFLGAFLIGRAFGPVAKMASAASRISETNLKSRLPEPPGDDEVGFLARTLNALLHRLELDRSFQENLVQDLSHQLRTPLTVLRGRNEGALNLLKDHQRIKEVLEDNLMDIDQVVSFLNTMLHLAKLENGLEATQKVQMDLVVLVQDLVDELEPLWDEKNIHIVASHSLKELPWQEIKPVVAVIDPFQTRQTLMNIFDNAYRYAPENSRIVVDFTQQSISRRKSLTKLTIFNSGPAIPPESLEKIFKRFYRVHGQSESEGFGLGLAIAFSLMEAQGGRLRAFNPPEGGAAFELSWDQAEVVSNTAVD